MTQQTAHQILAAHGLPNHAIDEALTSHARELGAMIGSATHADPACAPPNTPRTLARRGGMIAARLLLTRYADTLTAATVDGGERP